MVYDGGEGLVAGMGGIWSRCNHSQEAETNAASQLLCSLLFSLGPKLRVGLPLLVKPSWTPHKHTQRYVSMVILNLVQLMMKIDCCTYKLLTLTPSHLDYHWAVQEVNELMELHKVITNVKLLSLFLIAPRAFHVCLEHSKYF